MLNVRLTCVLACRMDQHFRIVVGRLPCRKIAVWARSWCRSSSIEAQPVEKPLDLAVGLLRRWAPLATRTVGRSILALQIDCMSEALLVAFLIEESLQAPQFPN